MIAETSFTYQLGRGAVCVMWAAYVVPWVKIMYHLSPHIWQGLDAIMGSWTAVLFIGVVAIVDWAWGDDSTPVRQNDVAADG